MVQELFADGNYQAGRGIIPLDQQFVCHNSDCCAKVSAFSEAEKIFEAEYKFEIVLARSLPKREAALR